MMLKWNPTVNTDSHAKVCDPHGSTKGLDIVKGKELMIHLFLSQMFSYD